MSSAAHIDNYDVLFQVQLEESGKHGQFYHWLTSAFPLRSSFCDVLRLVNSIHGHSLGEIIPKVALGWLCRYISKAENYLHDV